MNEEPVLGVVTIPVTGDVYYATKGEGAFHRLNDVVTPLEKRKPADLNKTGLRVVASRSHMNEETTTFIQQLKEPKLISAGSSLKFIAVAKGEADLYPRYIPCMEWDTAAADVIVREVGLSVVDIINKQPLSYNKENLLNPFFICS
jgi:3'(2'), 5'-bisphosphate nucleotidase